MKVVINGAGVAGPALAYWLHRTGHEVVLVEQAPHFRTGGYVIDFWGLGYTLAERMGILPEVRRRGYSVEEVRLVDERGKRVGGFPVDLIRQMTDDRFTSIPRGDLARAIFQTIEDKIESLFGNSIAGIEEREHDVVVSFEHGDDRVFDLVIGADGLHSRVRQLVFGPDEQFEKQIGYHVAAFEVSGYRPRDELVYTGFAVPGRQVARFALRDDRTLFLFVFASKHMTVPEPRETAERKQAIRQVFGNLGWECPQIMQAMEPVEEIYFDRVSQIRMDRWSKGRVMLLGDAAACVSLLAGEGTGLAMIEAYVLAGELNHAGPDYPAAFRRYEERLRPFLVSKQDSARDFAGAFAPKTRFGVWFRNRVSRMLSIGPIARYFIGRSIEDNLELPFYEM